MRRLTERFGSWIATFLACSAMLALGLALAPIVLQSEAAIALKTKKKAIQTATKTSWGDATVVHA